MYNQIYLICFYLGGLLNVSLDEAGSNSAGAG